MKKIFTLTILSLIAFSSFGQLTFQKTYGDVQVDNGKAITGTIDGGYVIVGDEGYPAADSTEFAFYRLDGSGNLLYSVKFSAPNDDFISDIVNTNDGGYIVVGTTNSTPFNVGHTDIFAIKIDDSGFPIWQNLYGGQDDDAANGIMKLSTGGYIISGSTYSYGTAIQSACMIKINDAGDEQWASVYSDLIANSFSRAVEKSPALILASGNTTDGSNSDHYLIETDTAGTLIWSKRYDNSINDLTSDIKKNSSGGIVIAGSASPSQNGDADQTILNLDSAGNVLWSYNYGTPKYDRASAIQVNDSGQIVVCGVTDVGQFTSINQMSISKMDSSGNVIWSNTYGDFSETSEGYAMMKGNIEGYFACGFVLAFSDITNGDAYGVKVDEAGESGCFQFPLALTRNSLNTQVDSTLSSSTAVTFDQFTYQFINTPFVNQFGQNCFSDAVVENDFSSALQVYPSPTTSALTVDLGDKTANATLKIFDILGNIVLTKQITAQEKVLELNISAFKSGVYQLTITSDKGFAVKSIVKQ